MKDTIIIRQADTMSIYLKGLEYYNSNKITYFVFDKHNHNILSTVKGTLDKLYTVRLHLDNHNENIDKATCSCPYSDGETNAGCKHIVATLKHFQDNYYIEPYQSPSKDITTTKKPLSKLDSNKQSISNFINYLTDFEQNNQNTKELAELSVKLSFETNYLKNVILELKIGTNSKMYVMKNIGEFIESYQDGLPIYYGQNFTFDTQNYYFNESDKELIKILIDEYKYKFIDYSRNTIDTTFGKQFKINSSSVYYKILEVLKNKNSSVFIDGTLYENINIKFENLPIDININSNSDNIVLDFNNYNYQVLDLAGISYFYNNTIWLPSSFQQGILNRLSILRKDNIKSINFNKNNSNLISKTLPILEQISNLNIDENSNLEIFKENFRAQIYFDKYRSTNIKASLQYHYGEFILNPITNTFKNNNKSKIIIRDLVKENNLLDILYSFGFYAKSDNLILDNDDSIYNFLTASLDDLAEKSELFYSENFKSIKVPTKFKISAGVNLNSNTDLLEVNFDLEGIDLNELDKIFTSLKKNKKYHRLKNGSFLELNNKDVGDLLNIIEQLDVSASNFSKNGFILPKYRALHLDKILSESRIQNLNLNHKFKDIIENIQNPNNIKYNLPKTLKTDLRDYQIFGYKWLKTLDYYGFGGILADDMGLGKTIQILSLIEDIKNEGPTIAIVPTSLVYNWKEEANKFIPSLKVTTIAGSILEREKQFEQAKTANLIVTSYALIRRDIDKYKDFNFRLCILDESQHVKNTNTLNARAVRQLKSKTYFALTGTPIENNLTELWSIFDFIMPGYLHSHAKFMEKYEKPIIRDSKKNVLISLSNQIAPFILRRLKQDVLSELPDKIETKLITEMTSEQSKTYFAYLAQTKKVISQELSEKGFENSQIKILAALTRLRQICCHPSTFLDNYHGGSGKLESLIEIVQNSINSNHRILLFSQFTEMLNIIEKEFDRSKITYFRLDGSVKSEIRMELINKFNNGENNVFLVSLKAGGVGINLTGADTVIHYDPWWNPAVQNQATDRAYRIGQDKKVQVFNLITKDTIEEKIYELQEKKKDLINSVIKPGEKMISKLSEEEIMTLFDN